MKTLAIALLMLAHAAALPSLPQTRNAAATSSASITIAHIAAEPGRASARAQVAARLTRAWKQQSDANLPLNLIILDCDAQGRPYQSEMNQLFPKGVKHLSATFIVRRIYVTEPTQGARIQYLGRTSEAGFKFVLFRLLDDTDDGTGHELEVH